MLSEKFKEISEIYENEIKKEQGEKGILIFDIVTDDGSCKTGSLRLKGDNFIYSHGGNTLTTSDPLKIYEEINRYYQRLEVRYKEKGYSEVFRFDLGEKERLVSMCEKKIDYEIERLRELKRKLKSDILSLRDYTYTTPYCSLCRENKNLNYFCVVCGIPVCLGIRNCECCIHYRERSLDESKTVSSEQRWERIKWSDAKYRDFVKNYWLNKGIQLFDGSDIKDFCIEDIETCYT